MSCCDNQTEAICPCDTFIHPRVIFNPPALDAISYRVGDYTTFRHALLLARPGEGELTRASGTRIDQIWRPGASGDLAVQMVEWWAYLADVLTFYNERVAGQAYLRTADLPESVNRLIRVRASVPWACWRRWRTDRSLSLCRRVFKSRASPDRASNRRCSS